MIVQCSMTKLSHYDVLRHILTLNGRLMHKACQLVRTTKKSFKINDLRPKIESWHGICIVSTVAAWPCRLASTGSNNLEFSMDYYLDADFEAINDYCLELEAEDSQEDLPLIEVLYESA